MADADIAQTKTCTKCGVIKPITSFTIRKDRAGPYAACRACRTHRQGELQRANPDAARARVAKFREENRDRINDEAREKYALRPDMARAKVKAWRDKYPDRSKDSVKAWRDANKSHRASYSKKYRAENIDLFRAYDKQRRSTPQGKIENAIKSRIWKTLTSGKGGMRTFDALGYSSADLISHLERQFQRGMTWENYGEWHVDHIIPLSSFEYETVDCPAFRAAWALSNLRPLWGVDNLAKGAKRMTLL